MLLCCGQARAEAVRGLRGTVRARSALRGPPPRASWGRGWDYTPPHPPPTASWGWDLDLGADLKAHRTPGLSAMGARPWLRVGQVPREGGVGEEDAQALKGGSREQVGGRERKGNWTLMTPFSSWQYPPPPLNAEGRPQALPIRLVTAHVPCTAPQHLGLRKVPATVLKAPQCRGAAMSPAGTFPRRNCPQLHAPPPPVCSAVRDVRAKHFVLRIPAPICNPPPFPHEILPCRTPPPPHPSATSDERHTPGPHQTSPCTQPQGPPGSIAGPGTPPPPPHPLWVPWAAQSPTSLRPAAAVGGGGGLKA